LGQLVAHAKHEAVEPLLGAARDREGRLGAPNVHHTPGEPGVADVQVD
jgi:hypothetical protein